MLWITTSTCKPRGIAEIYIPRLRKYQPVLNIKKYPQIFFSSGAKMFVGTVTQCCGYQWVPWQKVPTEVHTAGTHKSPIPKLAASCMLDSSLFMQARGFILMVGWGLNSSSGSKSPVLLLLPSCHDSEGGESGCSFILGHLLVLPDWGTLLYVCWLLPFISRWSLPVHTN